MNAQGDEGIYQTMAAMNLRNEFETAWLAGQNQDALLDLVHRHQSLGMSAQDVYRTLHQLWQERGFDNAEEACSLQNNLEYVLEKVWYDSPVAK